MIIMCYTIGMTNRRSQLVRTFALAASTVVANTCKVDAQSDHLTRRIELFEIFRYSRVCIPGILRRANKGQQSIHTLDSDDNPVSVSV